MRKPKVIAYLTIVFIVVCTLWISRKIILKNIIEKLTAKTESRFDLDINFSKADLKGISTIYFTGLHVTNKQNHELVAIDSIAVNVKIFPLIVGKLRLNNLTILGMTVVADSNLYNLRKVKQISEDTTIMVSGPRDYNKTISGLYKTFFDYIPKNFTVRRSEIKISKNNKVSDISIETFTYQNRKFAGDFQFADSSMHSSCFIAGELNYRNYEILCKISHSGTDNIQLPFIGPQYNAYLSFDTLQLSCALNKIDANTSRLNGYVVTDKFKLFHKRISADTIVTSSNYIMFNVNIGEQFLELDSTSVFKMNKFSFSPYLKLQKDTSLKIDIAIIRSVFDADDLISSFPDGLFSTFKGLKTSGKLAYEMRTQLDMGAPDSVHFYSRLENISFKIVKFGQTNFSVMSTPFYHEVYEKDWLVKSFIVGAENPDFAPIDEISTYLKYAVLTSEDGDFYYHHGFNENAFRESIAKNIKEKRFARGGSTITMQLIKNVFLNRNKTISRKIEEALIVWLIENQKLTSKERMFEVYLNIIEWGPGIYGIKPAARFYFNKSPMELTLSESIYLTSLIPRPKGFKYTFDNNGIIRSYLESYYQLVSGIMVRRNQILPDDTVNLRPIQKLTGEARNFLSKPDSSLVEDSLFFVDPIEIFPN